MPGTTSKLLPEGRFGARNVCSSKSSSLNLEFPMQVYRFLPPLQHNGLTGINPVSPSRLTYCFLFYCSLLFVMPFGRLRTWHALIDSSETIGAHRRSSRNQRRLHRLAIFRSGVDSDAARVYALVFDQVLLRVACTLRGNPLMTLFLCGCVTDDHELRVGGALQVQSNFIQASLGFIVDTGRTARIAFEVDRAQAARGRGRRSRRSIDRYRRRR